MQMVINCDHGGIAVAEKRREERKKKKKRKKKTEIKVAK